MANKRVLFGVVVFSLLVVFAPAAQAQPVKRVGVGFYAPGLPLASQADGFRFVNKLATHLAAKSGLQVEGFAYRRARDLERDARSGKIHVAVLGGFYVAGTGRAGRVLAVARESAGPLKWSIMAKGKTIKQLRGATMQVAALGRRALPAIRHALFGGQVDPRKYFKIRRSPNTPSAVAALKLGRAQAVFAPTTTKGLKPAIGGITVPGPAMVLLSKLPAATVSRIRRALGGFNGALTRHYAGFVIKGGGAYSSLVRRSTPRVLKMAVAPIRAARLTVKSIFAEQSVKRQLRPIDAAIWQPKRREE